MQNTNHRTSKQDNSSVNLLDVFFYLLSYWYWFALCIVLFVGFAYYKYAKMQFTYRADATVIIKDPAQARSSVSMSTYGTNINRVSVSNEILQFQSKDLMTTVVKTLNADVNYVQKVFLRDIELYKDAPVEVRFFFDQDSIQTVTESYSMVVTPVDTKSVTLDLSSSGGSVELKCNLGDTVKVRKGALIVLPTAQYTNRYFGIPIYVSKHPARSVANGMLARFKIRQTDAEGSILSLSLQDFARQRARDVLNTLVDEYNKQAIIEKNMVAVNTAAFINERLAIIESELGTVEGELAYFKSSQQIMSVDESASRYLSESRQSNAEIVKIETKIRLAEYLKEYLNDPAKVDESIPVNTGVEEPAITEAITKYNDMKIRRDKLIAASSSESPVVKEMDASLRFQRETITGYIDNLIRGLDVQKQDLALQESHSLSQFSAMPNKAREVLSIERQQSIKETLYMYLLNKREENALTQAMVDNNARMIDPADGPWGPIYPSRNKMLLLALLLGIALPAIILLAKLFLDTKVYTRKDIEDAISIPFVGEVPLYGKNIRQRKKIPANGIAYDGTKKGIFTEALRLLCTDIDFMREKDTKCPVLSAVSFNVGAGKTFVTTNVAACLADGAKKIVIVDLDLRKRTISRAFGLGKKVRGITSYLHDDQIALEDILHREVAPGIDLVPAGHIPPNPVELLRRPRLEELIASLRQHYDYILLDAVPVNLVADSQVVNRVVDMNLFIVRSGLLDKRVLPMLEDYYNSGRLTNVGVILNGTNMSRRYGYGGYGYGYGYGYGGYGYGYGYGQDHGEKES